MDKKNFAIFIDLENTGGKAATLNRLLKGKD